MIPYGLYLVLYFFGKVYRRKPLAAAIEITNKCPLHCSMCYWQRDIPKEELSDKDMILLFKKIRKQGIIHATLVGGEPTLRPSLIQASARIFPFTWVVTNGAFSDQTPPIPRTLYVVSVDGTKKIHDTIRKKGLYDMIWENFSSRSDCFISTTLTKINKNEIDPLVSEWANTSVLGLTFDFATPVIDQSANNIWLDWIDRDIIIKRLFTLKREYGDFILLSDKMLHLLQYNEVLRWSKNCPIKWISLSYSADGKIKQPCIIGKDAECSRCGCHIAPYVEGLINFDLETWKIAKKLLRASSTKNFI
jgi:MoaA/NifB/PqqE/SkfB family radical SAM enzyme